MTKKDVVALADVQRIHNRTADGPTELTPDHLRVLADFCASPDPNSIGNDGSITLQESAGKATS